MSEQTFGAWLLKQQERDDTTGALARAWKSLRDARGYNRHTKVKSIRELLSASLGEDWQALRGDESVAAAEAEWKAAETGQQSTGVMAVTGGSIDYGEEPVRTPDPAPMAVLWFDGNRYELAPGKSYVLSLGPVLREGTQAAEQAQDGAVEFTPDGHLNWAYLHGRADHSVPVSDDLVSLGLIDEGWTE